ncbi:MAG TPA: Dam family site-specific DNA-(adenine-N6)-methyltransferase [Methanocorpusculum sp.]|nr:Dam family site-specific DNA-(adenine-N6)-methyltransferase [Methanocorpusculum sp.]
MFVTHPYLPRPLVKWAGGKRQLMGELTARLPDDFKNYFEPFFGGGALYLYLWNTESLHGKAFLNDANSELINLYKMVRDKTTELADAMQQPQFVNTREAYLACRDRFNAIRGTNACVERAALFLYLNHHGYNGLWRVNRRGEYNIPFGRYKKQPKFGEKSALMAMALALSPAILSEGDFASVLPQISNGDFIYLDPPYFPVSSTENFTSYTKEKFGIAEHKRLWAMFREADRRGALVMLSNSVAPEILEMYSEFSVERVQVLRYINAKITHRRGSEEIIVRNY